MLGPWMERSGSGKRLIKQQTVQERCCASSETLHFIVVNLSPYLLLIHTNTQQQTHHSWHFSPLIFQGVMRDGLKERFTTFNTSATDTTAKMTDDAQQKMWPFKVQTHVHWNISAWNEHRDRISRSKLRLTRKTAVTDILKCIKPPEQISCMTSDFTKKTVQTTRMMTYCPLVFCSWHGT